MMGPVPPFLVIRRGRSFWVETRAPDDCAATLQAFREGCFEGACCFDATGGVWPIQGASLKTQHGLLFSRFLPWRKVAVELSLGSRSEIDALALVSELAAILESGNRFCDSLRVPPKEILAQLRSNNSIADVIRIAGRWVRT